jgi:hypothetical protein
MQYCGVTGRLVPPSLYRGAVLEHALLRIVLSSGEK